MTDAELIALVARMREAQRDYFKSRRPTSLERAKSLEAQVDKELEARAVGQQGLFA